MTLVQCDIQYNDKSKKETVTWLPKSPKIKAGDEIKFTSNNKDTAIYFKQNSPFSSSSDAQTIPIGMEKVLKVVKPAKQHFACGTYGGWASESATPPGTPPEFVSWGGMGGDIP